MVDNGICQRKHLQTEGERIAVEQLERNLIEMAAKHVSYLSDLDQLAQVRFEGEWGVSDLPVLILFAMLNAQGLLQFAVYGGQQIA